MLSNYCEGVSSSSLPLVPNTLGTSHKIWESFPGLIEWKSPWFKPMPTVEVISSVFHQSSDASTCEEKKVFFWGNITSQLAHWKATRGPHYYFFAVERVFIAVNTNKLKLNIWAAAVDHFRVSRGSHTHNNSLHCFTYRNLELEEPESLKASSWDRRPALPTYYYMWGHYE